MLIPDGSALRSSHLAGGATPLSITQHAKNWRVGLLRRPTRCIFRAELCSHACIREREEIALTGAAQAFEEPLFDVTVLKVRYFQHGLGLRVQVLSTRCSTSKSCCSTSTSSEPRQVQGV